MGGRKTDSSLPLHKVKQKKSQLHLVTCKRDSAHIDGDNEAAVHAAWLEPKSGFYLATRTRGYGRRTCVTPEQAFLSKADVDPSLRQIWNGKLI